MPASAPQPSFQHGDRNGFPCLASFQSILTVKIAVALGGCIPSECKTENGMNPVEIGSSSSSGLHGGGC